MYVLFPPQEDARVHDFTHISCIIHTLSMNPSASVGRVMLIVARFNLM